MMLSRI